MDSSCPTHTPYLEALIMGQKQLPLSSMADVIVHEDFQTEMDTASSVCKKKHEEVQTILRHSQEQYTGILPTTRRKNECLHTAVVFASGVAVLQHTTMAWVGGQPPHHHDRQPTGCVWVLHSTPLQRQSFRTRSP